MSRHSRLVAIRALLFAAIVSPILFNIGNNFAHAQSIAKTYAENGVAPAATFMASDEDGTELAWFLTGVDGGDFSIDDGTLIFRRPLDYEAPADADSDNAYEVSVNVTDGTNTTTAVLTVTVANVDEPGALSLSSLQPEVDIPLSATLTDPDGDLTDVAWAWESSTNATSWSSITGASSDSYTPLATDVGRYLRVTATYTDGEGPDKGAYELSYFVVRESRPTGHGRRGHFRLAVSTDLDM